MKVFISNFTGISNMQWLPWEKSKIFLWDTVYVVGLLEHMLKNEMRENESRSKTKSTHKQIIQLAEKTICRRLIMGKNSIMNCIHDKHKIRICMNNWINKNVFFDINKNKAGLFVIVLYDNLCVIRNIRLIR